MTDLEQSLQPAPLRFFSEIVQIPRASGDEKKIGEYIKGFAAARNLDWKQDGAGNILIYKPGQGGAAGGKPVIIQSHMDMVYVKASNSSHIYEAPLPVTVKSGWIFSEGTSLGADDGMGVAYALAVLDSGSIPHPDVYALFTVNEENGLLGANAMEPDFLPADRLLNIDGEEEGVIIAGCAGAAGATISKRINREKTRDLSDVNMCLEIKNLLGGHSGLQIHMGRANAVKIMARVLYDLSAAIPLRIVSLFGGEKMNAIPASALAEFTIAGQDREKLEKKLCELAATIKSEYVSTDPDMDITVSATESGMTPLSDADSHKVLQLLMLIPDGVIEMSHEMNGLVQTSNNLGTVRTEKDALSADINIRSAFDGQKYYILSRISAACELTGAEIEVFADYPAWEYRTDSDLRESCSNIYRNMFGKASEIKVIHGGLECGAFWKLKEGIDMISIGPDIQDVHTVKERLNISSALRVWEFVQRILASTPVSGGRKLNTMKALVKKKKEPGIWLEDIPVPEIGMNDVLIRIHKTSICGTDIHIYNWDEWSRKTIPVPMTIGHEFVGTVEAMGSSVQDFNIGDLVSGEGHLVCGHCRNCLAGRRHLCARTSGVGVNRAGAFAEYLSMPVTNVWHCDPSLPAELFSCFDPLGNATHAALAFDVLGEDVLITGAGPIGIMAAAVAKHAGARYVVITDINPYRLELAKKVGVTRAVDIRDQSLTDVMKELDMKEGFDVGLEMSGNSKAFQGMTEVMCHGGKISLMGIQKTDTVIDWDKVVFNSLTIKGIYGREMFETWYKMTVMLQSGLDISKVITHRFDYTEFQKAFEIMASGNSGKVILNWV